MAWFLAGGRGGAAWCGSSPPLRQVLCRNECRGSGAWIRVELGPGSWPWTRHRHFSGGRACSSPSPCGDRRKSLWERGVGERANEVHRLCGPWACPKGAPLFQVSGPGGMVLLACRHGAAGRRGLLSLLVQRKKQRNTPQAARPPRCALRVREWAGNFRKAHPCAIRKRRPPWRRPAGFTRPTRRASWGPEGNSHSKALSTDMSGPASGPLRSGSHGGSNPVGAAHRDVRRFRMTQDVSSGNSRRDCAPAAKRRAGRRGVLSLPTFFAQAKKVGPPRRAAPCVTSSRLAPKDACKRFVARECFR